MLIQGHIFLVFVLLLIGALTLWIFITSSKTRWFVKAIVTIALLLSISSAWIGLRAIYGFPYNAHPNNESYFLVGSYIIEPNPKTANKGNIFLWLIPKKEDDKKMDWIDRLGLMVNTTVPRAWVIPYDREIHKQLRGLDEARKGSAIAVKIRKNKKGKAHTGDNIEERQKFIPYILPENFKLEKSYTSPPAPAEHNDPTSDGWLGEENGTPDMQVDIGIGASPDGTPNTNNNTQEQQQSGDRGGITNPLP